MATVFDVAKYVLEKQGRLSTMKLQKLCYYCQAWSLVWDDEPLFDEEFRAWANGPVCKELFVATQGMFSVSAEDEESASEKQFEMLRCFLDYIGESHFYLTHHIALTDKFATDESDEDKLFSSICVVDKNILYDDYTDIFVFEVSVLFSINGRWVMIVQEGYPDGVAQLAVRNDFVDKMIYQN